MPNAKDAMKRPRRFPFAAIGLVLIAVSVAPSVIGMVRGFKQLQAGENATALNSGVALAFHPAFIACGVLGVILVVIGFGRACFATGERGNR
jgi:hypothetical protein